MKTYTKFTKLDTPFCINNQFLEFFLFFCFTILVSKLCSHQSYCLEGRRREVNRNLINNLKIGNPEV